MKKPTAELRPPHVQAAILLPTGDVEILLDCLSKRRRPGAQKREGQGRKRRPIGRAPETGAADSAVEGLTPPQKPKPISGAAAGLQVARLAG